MRLRTTAAGTAAALTVTGLGLLGPTATAAPAPDPGASAVASTAAATWRTTWSAAPDDHDAGGITIYEKATRIADRAFVMGQFTAYGEHLTVWDYHDNDRKAIVKLWVGASGPAVFYAKGDDTTTRFDLSFDEGQTVYLQACTSTSANAVCTPKVAKGRS